MANPDMTAAAPGTAPAAAGEAAWDSLVGAFSDRDFAGFRDFIMNAAGISLSAQKKNLVVSRLGRRLKLTGCRNFSDYHRLITSGQAPEEAQTAIDLLTTNETYFFREPQHFAELRRQLAARRQPGWTARVWSAASSTGEEAYSIAMTLAETLGQTAPWEVFASDISRRVLQQAVSGLYGMARAREIPPELLRRYCLKGSGPFAGQLQIDQALRQRVSFMQVNLTRALPQIGPFDVIFLRNVMIYFDLQTKQQVVARLLEKLQPGGLFIVGHAETLFGVTDRLEMIAPTVYLLPERQA